MNTKIFEPFVIREEFPIFHNRENLIYLDSAATTQKPKRVIDVMAKFYAEEYATVHRAVYELSMEVNDHYDAAREKVKSFIRDNKETDADDELTQREKDVLRLIALGHTNKSIADTLFISTHTVISHRKNITEKLGIKSIPGLTVYAIIQKIISQADVTNDQVG